MRVRVLPGQLSFALDQGERRSVMYSRSITPTERARHDAAGTNPPGRVPTLLTDEERAELKATPLPPMPKTRAECRSQGLGWSVPCPHVRCRYHMAQDAVDDHVTEFWPDRTLDQFPATCWEEVAERGPRSDVEISRITGLSVRSIERATATAFAKLRAMGIAHLLPHDDE